MTGMESPTETLSKRWMWLKVLYTFDAESTNNCVTRWPNVMEVQTAFVDDQTQVGVVDLKICLQALASSSPELLSYDSVDYTVYAFDYSEPGTPLSGQGLLSAVFDATTCNAPAHSSSKIITGRVTRNVFGLFSGNGQEILEVKLRLLPVSKRPHVRGTAGQPSPHDIEGSNHRDPGVQAWSNDHTTMYTHQATGSDSPVDMTGLENMQRMLHEGNLPRDTSTNPSNGSREDASHPRPDSRSATPDNHRQLNPTVRQSSNHVSRPASRASIRGASQSTSHKRRESFNSGYYSGDELQMEEGPPKKRAKITQIGAPNRSDLNIERPRESLRMAASTASSVRVHRPVAVNPALSHVQGNSFVQEPVRPPTPIPGAQRPGNRRNLIEPGYLRRESQQPPPETSYPAHSTTKSAEVSMTSPEFARGPSVASTPANIPSSPPVLTNYGSIPSSPMLPPPPSGQHDSGFMSGFDDLVDGKGFLFDDYMQAGSQSDFQLQTTIEQSAPTEIPDQPAAAHQGDSHVDEETTKAPIPPPSKPLNEPVSSKRPSSRARTSRPAVRSAMSSPKLAPAPYPRARQLEEAMVGQPSLTPVATSDPVRSHLQRASTWAGDMSDVPMSDAHAADVSRSKSVSKKRVGREQTKARLETALAQNEMPPYCDNCGTIDTPAWRRVFARTLPGPLYDSVELWPETPGAYVWKQVAEEAEDGTIRTFRAYKLSKGPEDKGDDWANVTLCNPCGLWFHKNKCMRPQEKWMRNPRDPNQKKKRAYRPKSKRVAAKKGQDEDSKSDVPDQGSEGSSPGDGATEAEIEVEDDRQRLNTEVLESELPRGHDSAPSAEKFMTARDSAPTYLASSGPETRDLHSSPIDGGGSHNDPAEVNLTPKPLCRQLFPSPIAKTPPDCNAGSTQNKSASPLSELPNFCRRSPRLKRSVQGLNKQPKPTVMAEKENSTWGSSHDDGLDDLFDDDEDGFHVPPQTPTPNRRSDRLLLKTPSKTPSGRTAHTPGSRTSPNANAHRALQQVRTPRRNLTMGLNRSVEEMTPCTRVIHEQLMGEAAAKRKVVTAEEGAQTNGLKSPPGQQQLGLDFSDLPSPNNLSPMGRQLASLDRDDFFAGIDFPDIFPAGGQATTTSPSNGYYNFLNSDYLDPALAGGHWDGTGNANVQSDAMGKSPAMQGPTGMRRSPRKNKGDVSINRNADL